MGIIAFVKRNIDAFRDWADEASDECSGPDVLPGYEDGSLRYKFVRVPREGKGHFAIVRVPVQTPVEILDFLRHHLRELGVPCALCTPTSKKGPTLIGGQGESRSADVGVSGFTGMVFSVDVVSLPEERLRLRATFSSDLEVTAGTPRTMANTIFAIVTRTPSP